MPLDATLTRDAAPHRGLRRALVGLVSLSLAFAGSLSLAGAAHATSPLGDTAASWPTTMSSYRYATGAIVQDPTGDIGLTTSDLTSGVCSGSSCTGGLSTSDFVSDGTNVFFRERIATDITDASKGGLGGNFFLVDIAVNGVIKAAVGVNGKSTTTDYVYATDANNTAATTYEVYDFPWTGGAAGARVIPDGSGQYFLDWQIPMKYITLASGGAITATTAVQLYYGSSAAANLAVINKDYFTGTGTTVDFTGLSTVSFGPTSATLTSGTPTTVPSGATLVSGTATTYDVALTAANPSGNDISGATVTTILPANVTLSSPPAGVTVSGSTVTWTIGSLLGGASASKTLRLTITPTQAQVGSTAKLLNTQAFSGADVAFGGTVTATGAAVNTPTVVAQGNRAPVANADSVTTNEDTAGTVNVLTNDTDADGNTLTATILTQPTHGTASVSGGVATYTPSANYNGADSFTYKACDPSSACSTATVSVTVTAVNDAPVATAYSNVTSKNVALVSTVTGTDVDGDTLTFAKASNPAHGTVVVAGNGGFTYTPTTDYMGSDSFTFTACDPSSACSTGTASITVTPTNVAPVAAADSLTTNEDTAGTVNVLTNDTDGDGDAMTVGSLTQPAHGAVTESGGGVTYTPAANYNGADSFTYKACDIYSACSAVTTVSVTVTAVNDVPTTTAYSGSTDKNVTLADTLTGADVDGDTLTFTKVADPAHGTVTVNANGTFSYVPTHNYAGPDSFTFKACDPSAACTATTTASITINPTNVAPTTAADSFTTNEDTATVLDVLANDTDADGDAMTVTVATQPTHGTTSSAGGLLTYTPDANYNGPDTFTYQACDPSSACSAATAVAITVTAVNDSPVATAYSGSTDTATPLAGTLTGTDVDGDPLTFQASGTPAHGAVVINADGTFTYTPSGTFVGTDTFSFQACDSSVCTTGTASITVTQGNRAPTGATSPSVDTDQDQPVSGAVSASDPDSDPLTYAVTSSTIGTLTFNADGTFTYTPDAGATGADSFTYKVCDPTPVCATGTVTITIHAVAAPTAVDDVLLTGKDTGGSVDVALNDTNATAYPSTFALVGSAAHGTAAFTGSVLSYIPDSGWTGTETLTYGTCSVPSSCSTASVVVTVSATLHTPVAQADSVTAIEDTAASFAVQANDSDADGDAMTTVIDTQPANGFVVVDANGTDIDFTPDANANGPDSFTYHVCDATVMCSLVVTVSVNVTPVNDAPTTGAQSLTAHTDVTANGTLTGFDVDGDPLSYAAVPGTEVGTVAVNSDGTYTYLSAPGWSGTDSFTFQVCDTSLACTTGVVTVTVTATNHVPTITPFTLTETQGVAATIDVASHSSDADNEALVTTVGPGPSAGTATVNGDGSVTYTSTAPYAGSDSFSITVCDPLSACATASVSVTIVAPIVVVNLPPVAGAGPAAAVASGAGVTLSGSGSDPESQPITFQWVQTGGPAVTLAGAATATPSFTAPTGPATLTFQLTVSDGVNSTTSTVVITVAAPVVVPPVVPVPTTTPAPTPTTASPTPTTPAPTTPAPTHPTHPTPTPTHSVAPVTVAAGAATLHKNGSSTTSLGGLVNGPVVPGSYLLVSGPQHGTAHLSADGVLTYAPDTGFTGTDSITFSVRGRDGKRYSATYVFTVRPDTLSFTGAPIDAFGGGGAAAVALGLLLIVAARRRHEDEQLA